MSMSPCSHCWYRRSSHQRAALKQTLEDHGLKGSVDKCLLVCKELVPPVGLLASLHDVIFCFCNCNSA